jgi:hypothetical protein
VPRREPSPFPLADAALAYLDRRRHPLVRLERVERARRRGDAWETNALQPEELQRPGDRPGLHRAGLDELQRLLTEELSRLDGARSEA